MRFHEISLESKADRRRLVHAALVPGRPDGNGPLQLRHRGAVRAPDLRHLRELLVISVVHDGIEDLTVKEIKSKRRAKGSQSKHIVK